MKAALNGVPSLSVLDGWWIEGHTESVTGWSIGERELALTPHRDRSASDATSLYEKLERSIMPLFYREPDRFAEVMRHADLGSRRHPHTLQRVMCRSMQQDASG